MPRGSESPTSCPKPFGVFRRNMFKSTLWGPIGHDSVLPLRILAALGSYFWVTTLWSRVAQSLHALVVLYVSIFGPGLKPTSVP
jgi:hypothetical protein